MHQSKKRSLRISVKNKKNPNPRSSGGGKI